MKKYLILVAFSFLLAATYAQDLKQRDSFKNEGLFGIVKAGFGVPLSVERQNGDSSTEDSGSKSSVFSLNAIGGYYIIPELSVGLGFGLDGLHNPSANTFPIYGDVRYYVKQEGNTWYGLLNYGRNLKLSDGFKKGELIRLGIGYKFFTGKTCWVADMHYGQYDVSLDGVAIRKTQHSYSYKRVIGFSVGIMF